MTSEVGALELGHAHGRCGIICNCSPLLTFVGAEAKEVPRSASHAIKHYFFEHSSEDTRTRGHKGLQQ
jgi:hypothetical protein